MGLGLAAMGCGEVDYVLGKQPPVEPIVTRAPIHAGRVDIEVGGPFSRLLLGDVTGDGRLDIVTMQPDYLEDDREIPHQVACLTAFDLEGNQIWQIGSVDEATDGSGTDIPAQIYDLDEDGENEVLAVMDDTFRVFDGATGELEVEHELPTADAHDAIAIANFRGEAYPSDILIKDRYSNLWAYDRDWNLLFTFEGTVGHYPWPYDWDGDGRDELMAGCNFLDDDGTPLWNCDDALDGLADAIFAGDIDEDPSNGAEVLVGGGNTLLYDYQGNQLFTYDSVESQNLAIGDFRRARAGLEVVGLDRRDRTAEGWDRMFLLTATGEELFVEPREPGDGWSTILTQIRNWDGSDADQLLTYNRAGQAPTIWDGSFREIAIFPDESALAMVADLCGDDRSEVLLYTDAYVDVFHSGDCDIAAAVTGTPRPQTKRLYNWTRYWGGEYP